MANREVDSVANQIDVALDSATVKAPGRLEAALDNLETVIDDPLFRTRIGKIFGYGEIEAAMAYEGARGAKAVLTTA